MVNIIADKVVFEEFLQHQVNAKTLCDALCRILPGGERRVEVENDMKNVTEMLSAGAESAAQAAGEACYSVMAAK